jgi:hypothetical protein
VIDIPARLEHRVGFEAEQIDIPTIFPGVEPTMTLVYLSTLLDGWNDALA